MWRPVIDMRSKLLMYLRHQTDANGERLDAATNSLEHILLALNDDQKRLLWRDPDIGPHLVSMCQALQIERRNIIDIMPTNQSDAFRQHRSRVDKTLCNVFQKHFKSGLRETQPTNFQLTRTFKEFIRGITYFQEPSQHISVGSPIYHRLTSCGPIHDEHYNTFHTCYTNNPNNIEAERRIRTCYIERLIYDAMYQHQTSLFDTIKRQDKGHHTWLRKTKEDFQTCYPNINIQVIITRYEGQLPMELGINIYSHKKLVEQQHYTRTFGIHEGYDPFVFCQRWLVNTNQYQEKFQEFSQEHEWQEVERNTMPPAMSPSISLTEKPLRKTV